MQPAEQRFPIASECGSSASYVHQAFANLGKQENVGHYFSITRHALATDAAGSLDELVARLPRPGYEHGIWHDAATGNLLVIRADKDGLYDLEALTSAGCNIDKRLR